MFKSLVFRALPQEPSLFWWSSRYAMPRWMALSISPEDAGFCTGLGRYYTVPKSCILPKPVQNPHPPIYLAAFAPGSLNRVARLADGWNPGGIPADAMKQMFDGVKQTAEGAGRDPTQLELVVRANVEIDDKPRPATGAIFTGTLEQIGEDLEACKRIGAHEVHFDPVCQPGAQSLNRWLELMEQLRELR